MDGIEITLPSIQSVALTPNPVATEQTVTVSVVVTEIIKILEPVYPYSGDVFSGEWP